MADMTPQTERPYKSIIVSNRGPLEYHDAYSEPQLGSGGLVTGLIGATEGQEILWLSLAKTDADRGLAHRATDVITPVLGSATPLTIRFVDVPQDVFNRHYDDICNRIFWCAHHYLYPSSNFEEMNLSKSWYDGYAAVNQTMATALIDELRTHDITMPILFQDYHLYLAPEIVRKAVPEALLSHISYTPWPDIRYWSIFPHYMIEAIFQGLAATDIISFQTMNDMRNFFEGVAQVLCGVEIHWNGQDDCGNFHWRGRDILVKLYPIALSPRYLHNLADSPEAEDKFKSIQQEFQLDQNCCLILREDRLEPTKNILRGFQAYEKMLGTHKELHGKVTFLALLVPTRQNMTEYRSYEEHIRRYIDHVNAQYASPGWQPIIAIWGNDRLRGLACLKHYDVLLVNPVIDGMNLVVKEGGLVNQCNGLVILSRTAGAYDVLGKSALSISPIDIDDTADVLYAAVTMPADKRQRHAAAIREILHKEDGKLWFDKQLQDLRKCGLL